MDWNHIERNWDALKEHIKTRWAKLTDSDLDNINGDWDEFVSVIQHTYGYDRAQAQNEVYNWQGSQDGLDNNDAPAEDGVGVYDNPFGYQETSPQKRIQGEQPEAAISKRKSFEQPASSGKGIEGTITLPHHHREPKAAGVRNATGENTVRSAYPPLTEGSVLLTAEGKRHQDPENNKYDIRGPGGIPVNNDDFQNDEGHEEEELPIPNPLPDDMKKKEHCDAEMASHDEKHPEGKRNDHA